MNGELLLLLKEKSCDLQECISATKVKQLMGHDLENYFGSCAEHDLTSMSLEVVIAYVHGPRIVCISTGNQKIERRSD